VLPTWNGFDFDTCNSQTTDTEDISETEINSIILSQTTNIFIENLLMRPIEVVQLCIWFVSNDQWLDKKSYLTLKSFSLGFYNELNAENKQTALLEIIRPRFNYRN